MRFFIFTKKQLLTVCGAVLAIAVGAAVSVGVFAKTARKLPIYSVSTEEKKVALTFDAAWGADDTDLLISELQQYGARATFFVVGEWVDKYPDEVKKLAEAGNDVMNHSATHPYMTSLSAAQMSEQLRVCNEKIAAVTGKTPTLFRCPYGDYNDQVIEAVESAGMQSIQWDVDSLDWKEQSTVESIVTRVTGKVKPGSIILFHNDAKYTPQALPMILEKLIAEGYTFVKVADLVATENYTIDNSGMQILNKE